jgi:predicted nuclease of predicted toxin-antitoxin system
LIDECLHTSLIEVATAHGHEATHVNYRGLAGTPDWGLMEPIREGGFTFVTNNARDFRRLYARQEIHAGLVILVPNVPPIEQREFFAAALDELGPDANPINEVLEVSLAGGEIQLTRYPLAESD